MLVAEHRIEAENRTVVITVEQTSSLEYEVDVKEDGRSIDNEDSIFTNLDEAMSDYYTWVGIYTELTSNA